MGVAVDGHWRLEVHIIENKILGGDGREKALSVGLGT
jgi:hypothetical protein